MKHAPKPLIDRAYGQFASGKLIVRRGRLLKIRHRAITRAPSGQHACDTFQGVFGNVQK
jgi:hypothetical protein